MSEFIASGKLGKTLRDFENRVQQLQAENAALKAELASAERLREGIIKFYTWLEDDAKRYRWLRNACETKEGWGFLICDADGDVVLNLDAAIDAAMQKENGK